MYFPGTGDSEELITCNYSNFHTSIIIRNTHTFDYFSRKLVFSQKKALKCSIELFDLSFLCEKGFGIELLFLSIWTHAVWFFYFEFKKESSRMVEAEAIKR